MKRDEEAVQEVVPTPLTCGFMKTWNADDSVSKRRVLLSKVYKILFSSEIPPEISVEQIRLKVAYKLLEIEHAVAGRAMPERAARNSRAAESCDVKGMESGMRQLTEITIKKGEEEMAKAKKNGASKAKIEGVAHIYLEIFQNQTAAKLTDAQIAAKVKDLTGAEPTMKNVASYRCMFNAGGIAGQSAMPKDKVKAVRLHKAKAKKPMDEATKAKLRAYAEKKKKAKK